MRFELTPEELNSALWKKLRAHYENKLNITRRVNDQHNSIEETANCRGRLFTQKELLRLDPTWKE